MTLKLEGDLSILKMYLNTENEAARLRHSLLRAWIRKSTKICQRSMSKCKKLQQLSSSCFRVACYRFFAAVTLTLDPWPWNWTYTFWRPIFTPKMKLLGKTIHNLQTELIKYLSRSKVKVNVTNFQSILAFTVRHVPTKLHRFPASSLRDFLWTGRPAQRCQQSLKFV